MAAVLQIREMSASGAGVNKKNSTIRFKNADNSTVDTSDPLIIPSSGSVYSYTKTLRMYMSTAPTTQAINLRMYTDGTNNFGTGITVTAKNVGKTFVTHYNTVMSGGTNLFSYTGGTTGSCLDMDFYDNGPFAAARVGSYIGDLVDLQMAISSLATAGTKSTEAISYAWDDT